MSDKLHAVMVGQVVTVLSRKDKDIRAGVVVGTNENGTLDIALFRNRNDGHDTNLNHYPVKHIQSVQFHMDCDEYDEHGWDYVRPVDEEEIRKAAKARDELKAKQDTALATARRILEEAGLKDHNLD